MTRETKLLQQITARNVARATANDMFEHALQSHDFDRAKIHGAAVVRHESKISVLVESLESERA